MVYCSQKPTRVVCTIISPCRQNRQYRDRKTKLTYATIVHALHLNSYSVYERLIYCMKNASTYEVNPIYYCNCTNTGKNHIFFSFIHSYHVSGNNPIFLIAKLFKIQIFGFIIRVNSIYRLFTQFLLCIRWLHFDDNVHFFDTN